MGAHTFNEDRDYMNPIEDKKEDCPDVMRLRQRSLSSLEIGFMNEIKEAGNGFHKHLCMLPNNRETSLAKTKLEECIMWAVKGITG